MEDPEDDSIYVYLEFNEKLTPTVFANKMFLRIANLDKPNPLVQINDLLFKGSYDECAGTNLFFEEITDPPSKTNIFEDNPPIRLKPILSQTKIIRLKQMKLPRQNPSKNVKETVALNLNQDYNTVLEKLEQGVLNLDDLGHREPDQNPDGQFDDISFETMDAISTEPEKEIDGILDGVIKTATTQLEAKYEKLRRLARRPVKRMKSPELVEECDPHYRESYEYHNLERQICQSSDAFRSLTSPIVEKSFIGGVDIDRCVLQGLLPASNDLNRVLSAEEQRRVLTIDNFQNLSLPARYLVLKECVAQIEELMETTPSDELKEIDDNGKNIADICDIFRKLVSALERKISQGSEDDDSNVSFITSSDKSPEEYIKYKYQPQSDLALGTEELFNEDEWIDDEDKKDQIKQDETLDVEESDESMDENTDEKRPDDVQEILEESDDVMDEDSDENC